jgi:hypothetical protein
LRIAGARIQLKGLDLVALAAALAVIALVSVRAYGSKAGAAVVHLRGPGQEWVYPLGEDRVVSVRGPLGDTIVEIRGGQARVLSSPCAEKICVRSGAIARPGQWIACLPNRVFLDIQGSGRSADAVSF